MFLILLSHLYPCCEAFLAPSFTFFYGLSIPQRLTCGKIGIFHEGFYVRSLVLDMAAKDGT